MSGNHVIPANTHQPVVSSVEMGAEHDPIVHVPHPHDQNRFVEVRRSSLQPAAPAPPRDLTPQPLIDPLAQRMFGGGVGTGVALWGGGQFLIGLSQVVAAAAGIGGGLAVIVLLLLVAKMSPSKGKTVTITNNNRWGGRSRTSA